MGLPGALFSSVPSDRRALGVLSGTCVDSLACLSIGCSSPQGLLTTQRICLSAGGVVRRRLYWVLSSTRRAALFRSTRLLVRSISFHPEKLMTFSKRSSRSSVSLFARTRFELRFVTRFEYVPHFQSTTL